MKKIKFSIIIPCYNTDKYIKRCLDSILLCNYQELEVICIDDGSSDNTKQILKYYSKNDSRMKCFFNNHKGVSSTRNFGLNIAQGDYIFFIDSDDYLIHDIFNEINTLPTKKDCIILNYEKIAHGLNINKEDIIKNVHNKESLFNELYSKRSIIPAWRFVVKSEIAKKIKFSPNVVFEDEEWSPKILIASKSFHSINTIVYSYRKRKGSILNTLNLKSYKDLINICSKLLKLSEQYTGFEKDFLLRRVYLNIENAYYNIRKQSSPRMPLRFKRLKIGDEK